MLNKVYSVCVIGGGAAGTMAALRTVLNNDECLFFPGTSKDKKKSRAKWVKKIENMPAHFKYQKGIEEPNHETIDWILHSPFSSKLILKENAGVTSLTKNENNQFVIIDSNGASYLAQFVILCTGVMDVQPEIQGAIKPIFQYANAQMVNYCLICDGHHVFGKRLAVIGHTSGAAWAAVMLVERYEVKDCFILTNGSHQQFDDETKKLIKLYDIQVISSPISSIEGEEKGKLLKGFVFEDDTDIKVDICFVALGMIVYNDLAKEVGALTDERGFVKTQDNGETTVEGLFVAGDLKANTKKQIYTSWDSAVNASNAINQKLRLEKRKKRLGII